LENVEYNSFGVRVYDKHLTLGIAIPSWAMRIAIPRLFHFTLLFF
jgi:hypothetical protein